MIDLWKMSQGQTASPIERQWVERIGAAAGRLARTVERMLKLVRNREFSQSLDTESIELGPIVRARRSTNSLPISSCDGRPCRVSIDPERARSRPTRPRSPTS